MEIDYTIVATFTESNSYGSSYAEMPIIVVEAPSASALMQPTPTQSSTLTTAQTSTPTISPSPAINPQEAPNSVLYVGITSVIVIIVLVAIAVALRRRK